MSAPKRPAPARVEVMLGEHGETRVQLSDPWLESWRVRVPAEANPAALCLARPP